MLNQAELNFYGFNRNNIIHRENRGRISVSIRYDGENRCYVVTRQTPRTLWRDRYKDLSEAKRRYLEFLYHTNEWLENKARTRKWG